MANTAPSDAALETLIATREQQVNKRNAGHRIGETKHEPVKVQNLLGDVLSAMQQLPTPTGDVSAITSMMESVAAVAITTRTSVSLSSGGFQLAKDEVSISIEPMVVNRFEKSVQADVVPTSSEVETIASDGERNLTKVRKDPGVPETSTPGQSKPDSDSTVHEIPCITPQDKARIISSPKFVDFFTRATKVVERALGQTSSYDIMADYSGKDSDLAKSQGDVEKLHLLDLYQDKRTTETRPITDIRTSPKFPELFLTTYGEPDNLSIADPDGCVLLWSLPMTKRPEYTFTCQSSICTALFDKYTPNLIIAGAYTGCLVLWDTRASSKPVQRTPISSRGHSHPVYSIEIVGTQHAHSLISVDCDGRLCVWSLSMLVHPIDTIPLKKGNRDLSISSIAFQEGETNVLHGGADDGSVVQAHIHGSRNGVTASHEGHNGPVSALHFHPVNDNNAAGFSDLLLSASFDWSAKLWSPRNSTNPLLSFENSEDYIYDIKWHPTNPGVFATSNGEGFIDIWNLCNDLETPAFRTSTGNTAINRICWSHDGKRLISGDGRGTVQTWAASNELLQPSQEDLTTLAEKLDELKAQAHS